MKWIGQHIWDFITRFRNYVYLEKVDSDTPDANSYLALKGGKIIKTSGGAGGSVTVQESDGSPAITDVTTIKVTDGTLTDNGSGVVTIATGGGAGGSINGLSDVESGNVSANDILVWDGSDFVVHSMTEMMASPTLYTFDLLTFNDNETHYYQLMGAANTSWRALNTMDFDATYTAGPPDTSAEIMMGANTTSTYTKIGEMTAPSRTGGTNNTAVINYPASRGEYVALKLVVTNDGDEFTLPSHVSSQKIYFENKIYYGASTDSTVSVQSGGDLNYYGFDSSVTSNFTQDRTIDTTGDKYIYLAYPSVYDDIHADGFKYNGITTAFESPSTLTGLHNGNQFLENYKLYRSTDKVNLGSKTLELSTSATKKNLVYWGVTLTNSNTVVSDFKSGYSSDADDTDITRVWPEITANANEFIVFAWPERVDTLISPTFWVSGIQGGFTKHTAAAHTNPNGFTEDYVCYTSNQKNLGATIVTTT